MSQLKEIQSRIESVKNTKQITRAMKMISAVKLRKSQDRIVNLRAYANAMVSAIADVALTQRVKHPFLTTQLQNKTPQKPLLVVLSSDRGLCGSFNYSICRKAETFLSENKNHDCFLIGKKAVDYFRFRNLRPIEKLTNLDRSLSFSLATEVSEFLLNCFLKNSYDQISILYQSFQSAIVQKITVESFLPIDLSQSSWSDSYFSRDLIFETAPEKIVDTLVKKHFSTQIYRAMCESLAAEHGARMCSMENATKNASDILNQLQLKFNKIRQSSITTELIEVTSGAEAMHG